ncbi:hypothetical protein LTS10_012704 [Elasticomyces elasticus]|nr:hypothetical protein LTS10_012704 [Elasticomyces elasticus]
MPQPSFLLLGPSELIDVSDHTPGASLDKFLARLCYKPNDPAQDWTPLDPSPFYEFPPLISDAEDAEVVVTAATDNTLAIHLTDICEASLATKTQHTTDISAQTIRTFKLLRQSQVLKAMWDDPVVSKEIQRILTEEQSSLYMIVGFKTCLNAKAEWLRSRNWSTKLSVSVTEILQAGGVPIPPWLQVKIDANCDRDKTWVQTASLFGEKIFAVRYRQVTRKSRIVQWLRGEHTPGLKLARKEATSLDGPMAYAGQTEASDDDEELNEWRATMQDGGFEDQFSSGDDAGVVPVDAYIEPVQEQIVAQF